MKEQNSPQSLMSRAPTTGSFQARTKRQEVPLRAGRDQDLFGVDVHALEDHGPGRTALPVRSSAPVLRLPAPDAAAARRELGLRWRAVRETLGSTLRPARGGALGDRRHPGIRPLSCTDPRDGAGCRGTPSGPGRLPHPLETPARSEDRWLREVDASLVLVNASTRFNDGFALGLGAEIGISTTKLHAYGPMGLAELCTLKWVGQGEGQVRQ